jgi:multidrug transporter EmrE-like cation transporter
MNLLYLLTAMLTSLTPTFIKQSIIKDNIYYILLAFISSSILIFSYYKLFSESLSLGVTFTIIKVLSIVFVILIDAFYFRDTYNMYQMAGFVFVIIAIILFTYE